MWKKSIRVKNYVVVSKGKNHPIFTFFDDFSARKFWETFTTRNASLNALSRTVPRLLITGGALPQPQ
jgi:hypothetical protein